MTRFQRGDERLVVDDGAACGVHHDRAHWQQPNSFGIQPMIGLGVGRTIDRKELALREHVLRSGVEDRAQLLIRGKAPAIGVVDFHIESASPPGHSLANAAHAKDPEMLAGDMGPEHSGRRPARPGCLPDHPLAFMGPSGSAQHQKHRDVRGSIRQDVGRVGHDDAARLGGGGVDMFIADREGGDNLD
jgi:hypothetical protein